MKESIMFKGAQTIVETMAGVKKDEKVLILCDSTTERLAELLSGIVILKQAEPFVLIMKPRKFHGEELPKPIANIMKTVDVIIAPTKYNIAHTKARFEAQKAGVRVVILPEAKEDFLLMPALSADFVNLRPKVEKMAKFLNEANEAKISSPSGTDFTCSIKGRRGRALHGMANEKDISVGPGIESSIAPVEGTSNGRLIINESIPGIGLIEEPIIVTVEKGYATKIEGGREALKFREVLEKLNDPKIYNIAELGIGMNPNSIFENSMLSDECVYGTIHIALGTSFYIGGNTIAKGHYDMVFSGATLKLDGKIVLKDGDIII